MQNMIYTNGMNSWTVSQVGGYDAELRIIKASVKSLEEEGKRRALYKVHGVGRIQSINTKEPGNHVLQSHGNAIDQMDHCTILCDY